VIEIDEHEIMISLSAWTWGDQWQSAAEQLYAQMLGWA